MNSIHEMYQMYQHSESMSYHLCDYFFDEEKLCELSWMKHNEEIHKQIINHFANNCIRISSVGFKIFCVDFVFPYARYYCFLYNIYVCQLTNIVQGTTKEIRLVFKIIDLFLGWIVSFEICYDVYAQCNEMGVIAPRRYYTVDMFLYNETRNRHEINENEIRDLMENKVKEIFELLVLNKSGIDICNSQNDIFVSIQNIIKKTSVYCTSRTLTLIRYCNEYVRSHFHLLQQMCNCGADFADLYCTCMCVKLELSTIKNYCNFYVRTEDVINNIVLLDK